MNKKKIGRERKEDRTATKKNEGKDGEEKKSYRQTS